MMYIRLMVMWPDQRPHAAKCRCGGGTDFPPDCPRHRNEFSFDVIWSKERKMFKPMFLSVTLIGALGAPALLAEQAPTPAQPPEAGAQPPPPPPQIPDWVKQRQADIAASQAGKPAAAAPKMELASPPAEFPAWVADLNERAKASADAAAQLDAPQAPEAPVRPQRNREPSVSDLRPVYEPPSAPQPPAWVIERRTETARATAPAGPQTPDIPEAPAMPQPPNMDIEPGMPGALEATEMPAPVVHPVPRPVYPGFAPPPVHHPWGGVPHGGWHRPYGGWNNGWSPWGGSGWGNNSWMPWGGNGWGGDGWNDGYSSGWGDGYGNTWGDGSADGEADITFDVSMWARMNADARAEGVGDGYGYGRGHGYDYQGYGPYYPPVMPMPAPMLPVAPEAAAADDDG